LGGPVSESVIASFSSTKSRCWSRWFASSSSGVRSWTRCSSSRFSWRSSSTNRSLFRSTSNVPGGVAERFPKLLDAPGLHDVTVNHSAVDGIDGIVQLAKTGHEQAKGLWRALANPFQEFDAAHPRHLLIGEDEIDGAVFEDFLGRFWGRDGDD